jgi:hypothetical protein
VRASRPAGRLERLLRAHDRAATFLVHPAALVERVADDLERDEDDDLAPGDRIDRHELIERASAAAASAASGARGSSSPCTARSR